ncbi:MAG: DUF748 domain-containing protein [Woeseiaceae bacterium]|nr:DUF748 domain-containing protein [Woeseiaceae bacterium]
MRLDTPRLRLTRDAAGELVPLRELRSLLPGAAGSPVDVAGIEWSGGTVDFTDSRFSPPLRIESPDWHGSISKRAGDDALIDLSLSGGTVGAGAAEITAEWLPSAPRQLTRVALRVRDLPLVEIAPYVQAAVGHSVAAGVLDGTFRLSLDQGRVAIDNQMSIKELQLRQAAADEPGLDSALQLAIALLQDKAGHIDINVPVPQQRLAPDFDPFAVFGDALAAYARAIAETPFQQLAKLAGQPQLSLDHLAFPAGSAEVSADTAKKISALGAALAMRPQLGLTVLPGYDPATDREALARQKIRLHVILAASAAPPGQAAGEQSIDFDDGRVRSVLDEFAQSRLPANRLARISNRHPDRNTAHYRAVFEALVDNEVVDDSALQRLARYRAQTIIDELKHAGIDSERIRQAERIWTVEPDAGRGAIGLSVWLVSFDPTDNERIGLREADPDTIDKASRPDQRPGKLNRFG